LARGRISAPQHRNGQQHQEGPPTANSQQKRISLETLHKVSSLLRFNTPAEHTGGQHEEIHVNRHNEMEDTNYGKKDGIAARGLTGDRPEGVEQPSHITSVLLRGEADRLCSSLLKLWSRPQPFCPEPENGLTSARFRGDTHTSLETSILHDGETVTLAAVWDCGDLGVAEPRKQELGVQSPSLPTDEAVFKRARPMGSGASFAGVPGPPSDRPVVPMVFFPGKQRLDPGEQLPEGTLRLEGTLMLPAPGRLSVCTLTLPDKFLAADGGDCGDLGVAQPRMPELGVHSPSLPTDEAVFSRAGPMGSGARFTGELPSARPLGTLTLDGTLTLPTPAHLPVGTLTLPAGAVRWRKGTRTGVKSWSCVLPPSNGSTLASNS